MAEGKVQRAKEQKGGLNIFGIVRTPCAMLFGLCALLVLASVAHAARIKDLGYINGVRPNQLIGYGLVVGLDGTGDKSNTIFTNQSLSNMLDRLGMKVDPKAVKVNNIAAGIITADLQPFAKIGNRIDAVVSSIGDAKSLQGGVLLFTPLKGSDGEVYAVAQGPLVLGGYMASGQGAQVSKNHLTVGRIVNGTTIEKELSSASQPTDSLVISLKQADFTTARRVAEKVNELFPGSAVAKDGGTVSVNLPAEARSNPVKFFSQVESLDISPDYFSKIVVNERTGTIVIGEHVRIATVAVAHGNLSVQIKEDAKVSQPMPFSQGRTVETADTKMRVEEERGRFFVVSGGVTIRELVNALNAIGVSARDIISVLQAVKAAGALHAELEVI